MPFERGEIQTKKLAKKFVRYQEGAELYSIGRTKCQETRNDCDRQIVGVFLSDPEAFQYGVEFSWILLTTSFLFGMFYILSNALQAMGAATSALIINMSRQGLIYIPAIFILQSIIGMDGLLWAQPVADILSVVLVVILYRVTLKNKIHTQEPKSV